MKINVIWLAVAIFAVLSTPALSEEAKPAKLPASHQAKPNLKVPEKEAEKEQRVVPKPGAPESKQPPPDVDSTLPGKPAK